MNFERLPSSALTCLRAELALLPIYIATQPDKYEGARVWFIPGNKDCLTQWSNLKTHSETQPQQ